MGGGEGETEMGEWSRELTERTRGAGSGDMMKSLDGRYGMLMEGGGKIRIVAVELKDYMPCPTDKTVAEYSGIDEMIRDGWAID